MYRTKIVSHHFTCHILFLLILGQHCNRFPPIETPISFWNSSIWGLQKLGCLWYSLIFEAGDVDMIYHHLRTTFRPLGVLFITSGFCKRFPQVSETARWMQAIHGWLLKIDGQGIRHHNTITGKAGTHSYANIYIYMCVCVCVCDCVCITLTRILTYTLAYIYI